MRSHKRHGALLFTAACFALNFKDVVAQAVSGASATTPRAAPDESPEERYARIVRESASDSNSAKDKEDEKSCVSFGLKRKSKEYAACRIRLREIRAVKEATAQEAANAARREEFERELCSANSGSAGRSHERVLVMQPAQHRSSAYRDSPAQAMPGVLRGGRRCWRIRNSRTQGRVRTRAVVCYPLLQNRPQVRFR
jgi:hypothetical protein